MVWPEKVLEFRHQLLFHRTWRNPLKKFRIVKSMLPNNLGARHTYLFNNGKLDYLGQILVQMGYNVEGKHRTPAALGRVITPFTIPCRGTIIDSKTTLDILALDYLDPTTHPQKLGQIMAKHNYEIVWEP